MANLTKSIKLINNTKNGEITINLNLNISVTKNGNIDISVDNAENYELGDPTSWEIPDIEVGKIINAKEENNE